MAMDGIFSIKERTLSNKYFLSLAVTHFQSLWSMIKHAYDKIEKGLRK